MASVLRAGVVMSDPVGHERERSRCRLCLRAVLWERTVNNRWTPVNVDGSTHWATCEGADEMRRRGQLVPEGRQLSMMEGPIELR